MKQAAHAVLTPPHTAIEPLLIGGLISEQTMHFPIHVGMKLPPKFQLLTFHHFYVTLKI
jgi:hypothetical protein